MPLLVILCIIYFVIGLITAVVLMLQDFSKKKAGLASLVGDMAGFIPIVFVIFVVLWPLWITVSLFSAGGSDTDEVAVGSRSSACRDDKPA